MNTMAVTSLAVFNTRVKPKITRNEGLVYEALQALQIATNDDIAKYLGWPIHCVTGRTNGLWKKSYIAVQDTKGLTSMGNKAKRWVVIDPGDKQLKLFAEQDCND